MGHFDPFAAWQKFRDEQPNRRPRSLNEAINPGQIHDPKDFLAKLRELSAEVSSQCAMLEQFVESHKGDPEWQGMPLADLSDALKNMIEGGSSATACADEMEPVLLQKERAEQMSSKQESGGPGYGGGKLFKK